MNNLIRGKRISLLFKNAVSGSNNSLANLTGEGDLFDDPSSPSSEQIDAKIAQKIEEMASRNPEELTMFLNHHSDLTELEKV